MNRKSLVTVSLIVLAMFALSAWAWSQIPETQPIPVHYGIDGTPDRFGGKFEGLLAIPLLAAGLTALFAILSRIEPRSENLMRSQKAYSITAVAAIGLLLALHSAIVLQALGWQINVATVVSIGLSVLLATIGNYLSKVRSNFSFGIRTPWTLSSEQSWNKTHRLGGRLLFFLGMGGVIAALANAHQLFLLLILSGGISITVCLFIYSYQVWKSDPDRRIVQR